VTRQGAALHATRTGAPGRWRLWPRGMGAAPLAAAGEAVTITLPG
jgi:hypothetical protein